VGTTGLNVGFGFGLINNGTGVVTVDPNGADTIDGLTTFDVPPGASVWVHCTGSVWITVANRAGVVPLGYKVASASATIDFTAMIGTAFNGYRVSITNLIPATDTADLWMRVSEDGGSSYKAGASDYRWCRSTLTDAGTRSEAGDTADAQIVLATNLGTGTGETLCGSVDFFAPGGAAKNKLVRGQLACLDAAPVAKDVTATGAYVGTVNAVNAIRFLMSTGNITSGTFALYGIRN
jgi:hypothetical protein